MAFDIGSIFNTLFPASRSAIMAKGMAVAGGTGPVRMKKQPSLVQSIMGMIVGVVLVFASPIAMWSAQSQHRAKDFASAKQVEATSGTSGYVTFSGTPSYATAGDGSACQVANCAWQKESKQALVTETVLECGNNVRNTENKRVLRQNGSECDENGNCVPCYDVEKDTWKEQDSVETSYPVKVGSYQVMPASGAIFLDTQDKTVDTGKNTAGQPTRSVYTYFTLPSTLLVAGDSDGTQVKAGEKVYVLSSYDHASTAAKLKEMDRNSMFLLMLVTFGMLFLGISAILGPLQWMGRQLRYIPVVGPMLAEGSGAIIALVSFLVAIPLWIVIFLLVVVIKLWWVALILLAAGIGFLVWKAKNGAAAPAQTPPPAAPQA